MRNNCNILLVANWESNVGYAWWLMENFWTTISDNFEKQGKKSYLIYPKISHIPNTITDSNIEVLELDFRNRSLSNLKKLYILIKQKNIKYIYLTDATFHGTFYLLLRSWGIIKIVVHDHTPGDRTTASGLRKILKSTIYKIPFLSADHFIAVTDFVYERFLNVACIPHNKCSCAPNGIFPIHLDHINNNYTQTTFGIPKDRIIIVSTGRASYYKGIDFLIDCANELISDQGLDKLHFLYCGDGPDLKKFKSLAKKYNLENNFTFAGNRADIRQILPSCDIGFHASSGEVGYSLSILEYMSAGLVAIVPNRPSTSLAITNNVNGIIYKHCDIHSATNAIIDALSKKKRERIRGNAIKLIREEYNIKFTNDKLIRILTPLYK